MIPLTHNLLPPRQHELSLCLTGTYERNDSFSCKFDISVRVLDNQSAWHASLADHSTCISKIYWQVSFDLEASFGFEISSLVLIYAYHERNLVRRYPFSHHFILISTADSLLGLIYTCQLLYPATELSLEAI